MNEKLMLEVTQLAFIWIPNVKLKYLFPPEENRQRELDALVNVVGPGAF